MSPVPLLHRYGAAKKAGAAAVRKLLITQPAVIEELTKWDLLDIDLRNAAAEDDVDMIEVLVSAGADVNGPRSNGSPEGCIDDAAGAGAIDAVRWLLKHGAKINHVVDGVTRCQSLVGAINRGHLEVVQLLVEHGAEINAVWAGCTPIMWSDGEIEKYLRSNGAKTVKELPAAKSLSSTLVARNRKKGQTIPQWFDKHWFSLYSKAELTEPKEPDWDALPHRDRVLALVGAVLDVCIGSDPAVLYEDRAGRHAGEIADALAIIGLEKEADAIRAINSAFPKGHPAVEFKSRQRQVAKLPKKAWGPWKVIRDSFEILAPNGERMVLVRLHDWYQKAEKESRKAKPKSGKPKKSRV